MDSYKSKHQTHLSKNVTACYFTVNSTFLEAKKEKKKGLLHCQGYSKGQTKLSIQAYIHD